MFESPCNIQGDPRIALFFLGMLNDLIGFVLHLVPEMKYYYSSFGIFFNLIFVSRNKLNLPPSCLIPPVQGTLTRSIAVVGSKVLLYLAMEQGGCFAQNDFVVVALPTGRVRAAAVFIL